MRDFKHTMDLLVKAYFEDNLKHESSRYCAVGNIVGGRDWIRIFLTMNGKQHFLPPGYGTIGGKVVQSPNIKMALIEREEGFLLIQKSGYSVDELARVEFAFETAPKGENDNDWMFNGLMAVLEVLADIHGVTIDGKKVFETQLEEIHATK